MAVLGLLAFSIVVVAVFSDGYSAYLPSVSRMPTLAPIPNPSVELYVDANRTAERDTAYAMERDGQRTEFIEPAIAR